MADDHMSPVGGIDHHRLMTGGVARGVEQSHTLAYRFAVARDPSPALFDVCPFRNGVKLGFRCIEFRCGHPNRGMLQQVILATVIKVQVGVDDGNHLPLVKPHSVEPIDDGDNIGGVQLIDHRMPNSRTGVDDNVAVRTADGEAEDCTGPIRCSRMGFGQHDVAKV